MASTETKPHIVIVPGACHVAHHYRLFQASLENAGYGVTVQTLPANVEDGTGPVHDSMRKSVAAVRAAVVKQIEKGLDVVVIGHSAGGAVVGGALMGLGKTGSQPGVVRALYLAAMLLGPGSSFDSLTQDKHPPFIEIRDGFTYIPLAGEYFYHDVPDDLAEDAIRCLVPCARSLAEDLMESVCWYEIPSVYILCEQDKAIPPAIAEWTVSAAQVPWDLVRLDASHSPFLSMPDRLAAVVRWAAGEERVDLEGVRFDTRQIDAEKAAKNAVWAEATVVEVDAM